MTRRFSLVEMLMAITVLLLLISLAHPALVNVLENSRRVICMTNLSRIGTLAETYEGDWGEGSLMASWTDPNAISHYHHWFDYLHWNGLFDFVSPFGKRDSTDVYAGSHYTGFREANSLPSFVCPSGDPENTQPALRPLYEEHWMSSFVFEREGSHATGNRMGHLNFSYGVNVNMGGGKKARYPSQTTRFLDKHYYNWRPTVNFIGPSWWSLNGPRAFSRHGVGLEAAKGRMHFLMYDLHVTYRTVDAITQWSDPLCHDKSVFWQP